MKVLPPQSPRISKSECLTSIASKSDTVEQMLYQVIEASHVRRSFRYSESLWAACVDWWLASVGDVVQVKGSKSALLVGSESKVVDAARTEKFPPRARWFAFAF